MSILKDSEMVKTLKSQHDLKQMKLLQERVIKVDSELLQENYVANLLLEAMNDDDLEKVSAIIDKLKNIKRPELPHLTKAIEQAEAEINKYTAGGPLTKAWTKMKNLVGVDNPIVKVTTFVSALEKGFSQIPTILKNNGINLKDADLSKSLASTLAEKSGTTATSKKTGEKSDAELAKSPFTGKEIPEADQMKEADVNVQGKLKSVVDQLRKALSPGGIFGAFKKVPYIDGAQLAQELVQVPLKVFSEIAKVINQGAKTSEIAPDMKSSIVGAGEAETKGTAGSEPSKVASQTQPTTASANTTTTSTTKATGETPNQPRGGGTSANLKAKVLTTVKSRLEDLGYKNINNLIDTLEELDVLKEPG